MHICHDVHLILPACTLFCGCCKLLLLVSQLFPQMSDSVLQHLRFASKGRKQECNIPKKVNKLMRKQNHLQTSSNNPGHLCCNVLGMCAGNRSRTCPGAILCRCARAPAFSLRSCSSLCKKASKLSSMLCSRSASLNFFWFFSRRICWRSRPLSFPRKSVLFLTRVCHACRSLGFCHSVRFNYFDQLLALLGNQLQSIWEHCS